MNNHLTIKLFILIFIFPGFLKAQQNNFFSKNRLKSKRHIVHPTLISTPAYFGISTPLRDAPVVSPTTFDSAEFQYNSYEEREINPDILPPDFAHMPEDPNVQKENGTLHPAGRGVVNNYAGQTSGSYPPDCNGTVNSDYYFQVVNVTYQIFNKSDGSSAAGPSPLNSIFDNTLPGADRNDGDPIVLWDEQADRWFYAEFSVPSLSGGGNDYMLIAVSTTNDPTGTWYSWAFDVDDPPDYMKFGIWRDGYYMATNTSGGNDVYVFERDVMIAGGANPQMIAFHNPDRPSTFDGFHCILPLDNDGPWAPAGTPGQFITIADDGQGNSADELRIYELNADWTTPSNSTFSMTQQIPVNAFSGNFTSDWNNIPQPGTSQKLDGLSTILMYRAQYRNFGGTQKIVCNHTIAVTSDQAAIRWYELQNTGSGWSIVQQSTYQPDNLSRWNGSIAMNDNGDIALGYSVSDGSTTYPGIRYCGHSAGGPANTMDIAETSILDGSYSQTAANRWGDYCNMSVDPSDGTTFWYTNEYVTSSTHGTRIASIEFPVSCSAPGTQASNFSVSGTFSDSLQISWIRGSGDSVLVVAREGSQVNSNPVSGHIYHADRIFGNGDQIGSGNYVIYCGTDNGMTVTGLNQSTTYYFSIYEFGGTDHCYLTPGLTGNATTYGPPFVTTAQITNIGDVTATGGGEVTSGNGATVTQRGICWSTSSSPTLSDSHTSDGSGTGSFTSQLTGLSPSTVYYVRAYAINSYGTGYGNEKTFTTACGIVNAFPYTENFDGWSVSSPDFSCTSDGTVTMDDCWQNVTGDDIDWDILSGATGSDNTGPSGDHTSGNGNYIYTEASGCYNSTGYVITPHFDLTSLSNPYLKFWYNMYGASMGTLSLQVSTDGGSSWSDNIWSVSGNQDTDWLEKTLPLASYDTETNLVFRFTGETGSDYTSDMALDDFSLYEGCTPPANQASALVFGNITDSTIVLSWNRGSGDAVLVVGKAYSPVDDYPESGTAYSADNHFGNGDEIGNGNFVLYNGTGTSTTIRNLGSGTHYYFSLYEYSNSANCYLFPGLSGDTATTGIPECTYCSSYGNVTFQTSTTYVGFNSIDNTSGKPSGYSDYTSISTNVKIGNTYNLSVRVNTDGDYTTETYVWIDWNKDCDFDDPGEEYYLGSATNVSDGYTSLSPLSVTIPDDSVVNSVRMRVSTKYSTASTACETDFDGEVEDYSINVEPGETGWTGNTNDWFSADNWGNGKVPSRNYIVTIPQNPSGSHYPVINSGNNAVCYKLILESSAQITVNGTLTVSH